MCQMKGKCLGMKATGAGALQNVVQIEMPYLRAVCSHLCGEVKAPGLKHRTKLPE